MSRLTITLIVCLTCLLALGLTAVAEESDYADNVKYNTADESPLAGFTKGESNSRIDDYINQDEQINLDKDAGIVKVLRVNQKNLLNDYVTAIIPCRNVNPRELRGPIRSLVRKEGGECDVIQDKVKNEYFLHVVCPSFQLPYVEEVIASLDQKWIQERMDGSTELYYQCKFRDANDVLNITQFYRGPEGRFFVDNLNNALLYTDQCACMGLQQMGLREADIPPNQALLDVTIYEIDTNNDLSLGLDWLAWKNGPGRYLFQGTMVNEHIYGRIYDNQAGATPWGEGRDFHWHNRWRYGAFNALVVSSYVDFLHSKGKAKVLTQASVMAKSGTPAEISALEQQVHFQVTPDTDHNLRNMNWDTADGRVTIHFPDYTTDIYESPSGRVIPGYESLEDMLNTNDPGRKGPFVTLQERQLDYVKNGWTGVKVYVTPYIGQESMEAVLEVDVSSVSGYTPQGVPMINLRHADSYVRLKDGEPFVLGGLKRTEKIKRTAKVPFLGSLPVVGYLFGNETSAERNTEIVVVIKPKVMLSAQSVLEMPQEAKTVVAQVEGTAPLAIPQNPFGFDQWLLDEDK